MIKIKPLSLFNLLSFLGYIGLFYAVHNQLLQNFTSREISKPYASILLPATDTALIAWGVLYTGLAIFCLYHFSSAFKRHIKHPANQDTRRVHVFFVLHNLSGIAWILTTTRNLVSVSLGLLAFQLVMLMIIHYRLNIYQRHRRLKSNLCTQTPFSLFGGWIFLLMVGGLSEYFSLNNATWDLAIIVTLIVLTLLIIFIRNNIVLGLVIMIALYVVIQNIDISPLENYYDINLAAWAGIWILGLATLLKLVIDLELKKPPLIIHSKSTTI